ncbi:deoxyuridine 5'-triphosphate nucleotidohydrolase-like isoform X1 [Anguilla anguilla]|nr:deoxyuridine 5'-triphosphate nucleotidohydrolase-like isoform X1 [Anguilla anguilla]
MDLHVSIKVMGVHLEVQQDTSSCLYHCPICALETFRPTDLKTARKHLESHTGRSFHHGGLRFRAHRTNASGHRTTASAHCTTCCTTASAHCTTCCTTASAHCTTCCTTARAHSITCWTEAINMPCSEVTQATASSPVKGLKTGPEELKVVLKFAKLTENATVPTKGSAKSAGYDLYSAYDYSVAPMDKVVVKTDIQIAVPTGCYGRVAPRSGLAAKYFIDVGAGVVDEDYRGNVGVVLFNFSKETFEVKKGDRVAQLICEKICYPELEEHKTLDETVRGAGGFGSTGKN